MEYMKNLILIFSFILMLTSCAESKTFTKEDGTKIVAEPYGWANYQSKKIDGVVYECNVGNVIWCVLGIETVIIPVWLSGWELYEPIEYIESEN